MTHLYFHCLINLSISIHVLDYCFRKQPRSWLVTSRWGCDDFKYAKTTLLQLEYVGISISVRLRLGSSAIEYLICSALEVACSDLYVKA
jgi:hypothetical protein